MIDNKEKIALVFGVRNDSSISWHIAKKLIESGCTVAFSFMPGTEREIHALLEQNGMDTTLATPVDVRNENEIENFINKTHNQYGRIDYILHGTAFGNQKVMCATLPGRDRIYPYT